MTDPITRAPWALAPPYDAKDHRLFQQPTESANQAHRRMVAVLAALLRRTRNG